MYRAFSALCCSFLLAGCLGQGGATFKTIGEVEVAAPVVEEPEATETAEAPLPNSGILRNLFAARTPKATEQVSPDVASEPKAGLNLAALFAPRETTAPKVARRNVDEVEQGVFLKYGKVAAVCGLARRDLGAKVEEVSGYTIYDAGGDPSLPRTHYVTGFDDGCARQVTAAIVMFGDIGTHEMVRYRGAQANAPYSDADQAYEAVKADFCRVRHGKPCGDRIDDLAKRTVFLTVYERLGTNPEWTNVLLHNGVVSAVAPTG